MGASDLLYPILCITKYGIEIRKTTDDLGTEFQTFWAKGGFNNMEIIDCGGAKYKVIVAKKLGGAGPFWGYSLMYSRRIKVDLEIEKVADNIPVSEVRNLIFADFSKDWEIWEGRADFDDLKTSIDNAKTIAEIIQLIS